jgi:hypothetical protein
LTNLQRERKKLNKKQDHSRRNQILKIGNFFDTTATPYGSVLYYFFAFLYITITTTINVFSIAHHNNKKTVGEIKYIKVYI